MLYILSTTLLPNFYPVNLQHSIWKHVFSIRVENTVLANNSDPDEMPQSAAFHLDLHYLQKYQLVGDESTVS